jgi:hypothetical protein
MEIIKWELKTKLRARNILPVKNVKGREKSKMMKANWLTVLHVGVKERSIRFFPLSGNSSHNMNKRYKSLSF